MIEYGQPLVCATLVHYLTISCPICAAPSGKGCFIPEQGGHQMLVSHAGRGDAARSL